MEIKNAKNDIVIPAGFFCGGNCATCKYWDWSTGPDKNGRRKCSWYGNWYAPSERQGCLSYERA